MANQLKNISVILLLFLVLGWLGLRGAILFSPSKIQNRDTYRIVRLTNQTSGIGTAAKETYYEVELSPYDRGEKDSFIVPINEATYRELGTYRLSEVFSLRATTYIRYGKHEGFSTVDSKEIRTVNPLAQLSESYLPYVSLMFIILTGIIICLPNANAHSERGEGMYD